LTIKKEQKNKIAILLALASIALLIVYAVDVSLERSDDGWANSEHLKAFAFDLELDMKTFENCLDSKKYEKKVKFYAYEAKKNGIQKIPTFVVVNSEGGHHIIRGAVGFPVFEQVIRNLTP